MLDALDTCILGAGASAADRDSGAVPARAGGDLPGPPDGGYPPPPPGPPGGGRGGPRESREERAERMRRDEIREDRCAIQKLPALCGH